MLFDMSSTYAACMNYIIGGKLSLLGVNALWDIDHLLSVLLA
uniref:Uncharacterized protein n=1 Tax=Arundo donax TaxID=35708 RepID=A0A0A9D227_ARUDO